MKRRYSAGIIAATAAAAMVVGTTPAAAQTDILVYTNDAGWGGYATFTAEGEHFGVCDTRSDGKRVVADWIAFTPSQTRFGSLQDANGSGNQCVAVNESFPEGSKVRLTVCLQDGASGEPHLCNRKDGVA